MDESILTFYLSVAPVAFKIWSVIIRTLRHLYHGVTPVTYFVYFFQITHLKVIRPRLLFVRVYISVATRTLQCLIFFPFFGRSNFQIQPLLDAFIMKKVLTSRNSNYLSSIFKFINTDNTFTHFEFILF